MKKLFVQLKGRTLLDVWYYLQGNIRYYLYYHKYLYKLILPHIKEQIDLRIKSMDKECYNNGECKICGCKTTALQMSNKPCDKPCYPAMQSLSNWKYFKLGYPFIDEVTKSYWVVKNNKFKILK